MKENKSLLAEILDAALFFVVAVVLLFLPIRTACGTFDSLVAAIAVSVSVFALAKIKSGKKKKQQAASKRGEKVCKSLTYLGEEKRLEFFANALSRFSDVEIRDGYVQAGKKRVYPVFLPSGAIVSECARIHEICLRENVEAVIAAPEPPDKTAMQFIEGSKRLKILSGDKLYRLAADMPPLKESEKVRQKGRIKKLFSAALDRSLFRRYLTAGALLIGASYVMPRSLMYVAFGVLCIALSLLCLIPKSAKRKRNV